MTTESNKNFSSAKKRIEIISGNGIHSLGGSIPLKIHYLNESDSAWVFREPSKTWEVKILVTQNNNNDEVEMPFGRIFFHQEGTLQDRSVEDATTIELKSKNVYAFEYDAGLRWPELFRPGINYVCIKDLTGYPDTLLSNKIKLQVAYDKKTILNLLSVLDDTDATYESQVFAVEWITKLHAEFKFNLEDKNEEQKKENQKNIADARLWWEANKTDTHIINLIESLNH